jgi:hypothetical protein
MKLIAFVLLVISCNFASAKMLTNDKVIKLNFSETDIDVSKITIKGDLICYYKKKTFDPEHGTINNSSVPCGSKTLSLPVINSEFVLPGIEAFKHRKGDDLDHYSLSFQILYNGLHLVHFGVGKNDRIIKFYNNDFNLKFKKFYINNVQLLYKGINVLNAPEFNGDMTKVSLALYPNAKDYSYSFDSNLTLSFKVREKELKDLVKNESDKLGEISLVPRYHAFINDDEGLVDVFSYAIDKENKWVEAKKITIPFNQESINLIKEIELSN